MKFENGIVSVPHRLDISINFFKKQGLLSPSQVSVPHRLDISINWGQKRDCDHGEVVSVPHRLDISINGKDSVLNAVFSSNSFSAS